MKLTKTQIAFLAKVDAKNVYKTMGYTRRRGAYIKFYGGEGTFDTLRRMGLVTIGVPSLGIRAVAELTDAGRQALREAAKEMRERLFAENGASINASKAVQAEEIALAIRSRAEG